MSLEKTAVEQLVDDLTETRENRLKADIRPPSKQDYQYLSGQHSCTRHLFYILTEGDKRPAPSPELQALFNEGKKAETEVIRDLLAMGYDVRNNQQTVELLYSGPVKELRGRKLARGKLDIAIVFRGVEIPTEIKMTEPNKFRRIASAPPENRIDLLLEDQFCEKWVRQLLMYLYGKNLEQGLFIIVDGRGHWMKIPVFLGNHLEVAEAAVRNMEKAAEAVYRGEAPERIAFHHTICGKCAFNPICQPTTVIEGAAAIDDADLEAQLERHEQLKPMADEYQDLHDNLAALFAEKPQTTVSSRFIVTPKRRVRTSYDHKQLDAETLSKIKREKPYWVMEIKDVTKAPEEKA